jgi:hypothetical protein
MASLLFGGAASAQMMDVDGLLTDAAAVPHAGTVRLFGSGGGQSSSADGGGAVGSVAGSLLWVPFQNIGGDLGAYYQTGRSGPAARVRYQVLDQEWAGVDLALGARYKSEGFSEFGHGEVEGIVALGRSFGRFDLVLNLVYGAEIGDPGMDAEVKSLLGWRFSDNFRLGAELRIQTEIHDEDGWKAPAMVTTDLIGGPSALWRVARPLSLQILTGVSKPAGSTSAGFIALVGLSIDLN